jgi:hypothetical protein
VRCLLEPPTRRQLWERLRAGATPEAAKAEVPIAEGKPS